MTTQPDALELFTVDITKKRLVAGEQIFIFTSGTIRGKLVEVATKTAYPSGTYLTKGLVEEPCVILTFVPGPRVNSKVQDPTTFNFTRKPTEFRIPVRAISKGFFLRRLEDKVWMLNIVTANKGQ